MGDENEDYSVKRDGEGCIQHRYTIKEIKEIKSMISDIVNNTTTNKANLSSLTESVKTLAESNSLTHYKLFARTEKLKVGMARIESTHKEYIRNDDKQDSNSKHKSIVLVSWFAIGISIVTAIVLAIQAGIFS